MRWMANSSSCNTLVSLVGENQKNNGSSNNNHDDDDDKGGGDMRREGVSYNTLSSSSSSSIPSSNNGDIDDHADEKEEDEDEWEQDGFVESHLWIPHVEACYLADANTDAATENDKRSNNNRVGHLAGNESTAGRRTATTTTTMPGTCALRRLWIPYEASARRMDVPRALLQQNAKLLRGAVLELNSGSMKGERVLNVLQGEVGHATSQQVDVVVSDRATTCHIVALRSCGSSDRPPLVSLCHLDRTDYDVQCLQDMVEQHRRPRLEGSSDNDKESEIVDIDVYLVGGYNDEEGTSLKLSNFVLWTLSTIASRCSSWARLVVQVAAISSLNSTCDERGMEQPVARGLGVRIATGDVFMAHVDWHCPAVAGPALELRSCRVWALAAAAAPPPSWQPCLQVIHTAPQQHYQHDKSVLTIHPFWFEMLPEIPWLLTLDNDELRQHTSTSPNVEDADFCRNVRHCFAFLQHYVPTDVFGPQMKSLHYQLENTMWVLAPTTTPQKKRWSLWKSFDWRCWIPRRPMPTHSRA